MRIHFLTLWPALLLLSAGLHAQESRGSISGTVTDASHSVVVGATLRLVNVETGVSFTVQSNNSGQYRFLFLNPGDYRLSAELAGFKTFVRDGIEIHVNQSATIDIALEVGALADSVTVTGEAPLLEAEKIDRGTLITNQTITTLPLNLRNPLMLAGLAAGVARATSGFNVRPFSNSGISTWSINGSQGKSNEFLMDGAPNNVIFGGGNSVGFVPPVDAIEEFKVVTGMYDAQYGRTGGGIINVSVKSGTNQFHGTGYEFLKRTGLNANTFSNNAKNLPRQGTTLDQYGGSFGGPVRLPRYNGKDRTFFFVTWEGYKEGIFYASESISSVPTPEQRRGDFSKTTDNAGRLITIFDPMTGRMEGSRWVRDAFPGNVIPGNRINPVSAKIASLYPEPNTSAAGSTPWQNNFILSPNDGRFNFNNYVGRLDHTFSARQRVYGRWSYQKYTELRNTNGIPGVGADWRWGGNISKGLVLDSVTTLSSGMIVNLRGSLTRFHNRLVPYGADSFDATQFGWPASLVRQLPIPNIVPRIDISEFRSLGPSTFTFEPTTAVALQPNLAMMRGRHALKAGFDYRVTRYGRMVPGYAGGQVGFDRGFTRRDYLSQDALSGNGMASFLLGYAGSGRVENNVVPFWQWMYYAPWVQDDIKLTRRLTINLGLRWDINLPPSERFNRMNRGFDVNAPNPIAAAIDQTRFPGYKVSGGYLFAGVNGVPRPLFDPDYNNIQPRMGAALQLTPRTVLRGGWGMFYMNPTSTGSTNGFSQSTPYISSLDSGRTPANTISNPFPTGVLVPAGAANGLLTFLGQGPTFSTPGSRTPYVHQFSFGIQQQLPGRVKLDVAYVGSRTRGSLVSKSINEISKDMLALGDRTKGGDPNYLTQQLPNPFAGLIPGTALNNTTASRSQLSRPFPQFTGFSMQDRNDGRIWYNSLQVVAEKRYSHGLSFTATYTLAKDIEALSYLNAQDERPARTLASWDKPHNLVLAPIYELPFGPGRRFLKSRNGFVSRLVGGWETTVSTVIQSGEPMPMPSNVWILSDPRLPNPTFSRMFKTGVVDVDGATRNVLPGEQPAFAIRSPNTLRTTPLRFGNLRKATGVTYDFSLVKNTVLREGMRVQFRAEAFNVFNTPVFSGDPNLDPNSANFGKLFRDNGQVNLQRNVQLGLRLIF